MSVTTEKVVVQVSVDGQVTLVSSIASSLGAASSAAVAEAAAAAALVSAGNADTSEAAAAASAAAALVSEGNADISEAAAAASAAAALVSEGNADISEAAAAASAAAALVSEGNADTSEAAAAASAAAALVSEGNADISEAAAEAAATAAALSESNINSAISTHAGGTGVHSIAGVTGLQSALNNKIESSLIGAVSGIAPLGADSKIAALYLPAYVDDVVEYASVAAFPVTGVTSIIYVALDTGYTYRWSGTAYTAILASPGTTDAITEGSVNLYFTTARAVSAIQAVNLDLGFNNLKATGVVSLDNIVLEKTKKFYLDGTIGVGGDTYITESSENVLDIYVGDANTLRLTATTAIVTGNLTATGAGTFGASTNKVILSNLADAATYGALSFNGSTTSTTMSGIFGRAFDGLMYYEVPTGAQHNFQIAGVPLLAMSATGTALTSTNYGNAFQYSVTNTSTAVGAYSGFSAGNGANIAQFGVLGTSYTPSALWLASSAFVQSTGAGGLLLNSTHASATIRVGLNSSVVGTFATTGLTVAAATLITGTSNPGGNGGLELHFSSETSSLISYNRTTLAYKAAVIDALTTTIKASNTAVGAFSSTGLAVYGTLGVTENVTLLSSTATPAYIQSLSSQYISFLSATGTGGSGLLIDHSVNTVYIRSNGANIATASATGLAVTGSAGLTVNGSASVSSQISMTGTANNFLTLSGNLYTELPTSFGHYTRVNGSTVSTVDANGLSVTGVLQGSLAVRSGGDFTVSGAANGIFNNTLTTGLVYLYADGSARTGVIAYGSTHATKADKLELKAGAITTATVSATGLLVTGSGITSGTFAAGSTSHSDAAAYSSKILAKGGNFAASDGNGLVLWDSTNVAYAKVTAATARTLSFTNDLSQTMGTWSYANGLSIATRAAVSLTDDNNGAASNPLHLSYIPGLSISNAWSGAAPTENGNKIAKLQLLTATMNGYNAWVDFISYAASNGYNSGGLKIAIGGDSGNLSTIVATLTQSTISLLTNTAVTGTLSAVASGGTANPGNQFWVGDNSASAAMFVRQNGAGDLLGLQAGATEKFRISNNGNIIAVTGAKLFLDGAGGAGGDTYLVESSANVMDIYAGGVNALKLTTAGIEVIADRIRMRNSTDSSAADFAVDLTLGAYLRTFSSPQTISFKDAAGVNMGIFSSTGLAVTGSVTASSTGNYGNVLINGVLGGQIQFGTNGTYNNAIYSGATNLTYLLNAGGTHDFVISGATKASVSSTGLAVTGTLSATGAVNGATGTFSTTNSLVTQVVQTAGAVDGYSGTSYVNAAGNGGVWMDRAAGNGVFTGGTGNSLNVGTLNDKSVHIGTNGIVRGTFSATGLAVTGTLNATGAISSTANANGLETGNSTGASARGNVLFRGSDGASATRVGYVGINVFGTDGSLEIMHGTANASIKIGTNGTTYATVSATGLAVTGTLSATGAASVYDAFTLRSNSAASDGPNLNIRHYSASPANNDELGRIYFQGYSSTNVNTEYALIINTATDVTNGSQDSKLDFYVYNGGAQIKVLAVEGTGIAVIGTVSTTAAITSSGNNYTLATGSNGLMALSSGTIYGAMLNGQGSSYDVSLFNKNGSLALGIPTGTVDVSTAGSLLVTSSITAGTLLKGRSLQVTDTSQATTGVGVEISYSGGVANFYGYNRDSPAYLTSKFGGFHSDSGCGLTAYAYLRSTSLAIPATNKIYLDGTAASGDTYIVESSANKLDLVANAVTALRVTSSGISVPKTSGKGIQVDETWSWRDLEGQIQPKSSGAGAPAWTTWSGNVKEWKFVANDVIDLKFHWPHDHVPDTDIYIHIHWSHNGSAISGGSIVANYRWIWGKRDGAYSAERSLVQTVGSLTGRATLTGYVDEIQLSAATPNTTAGSYQIDTQDLEPDGLLKISLIVTGIPTVTAGDFFIEYVDIHYQSSNVGTKNKTSNFYA